MGRILFVLPLIGSLIGALVLVVSIGGASGAPQEAAGAAIAIALAVIPYVLCRSIQIMGQESRASAASRVVDAITELRNSQPHLTAPVYRAPPDLSRVQPLAPHREPGTSI